MKLRNLAPVALVAALALLLPACGSDNPTTPAEPVVPAEGTGLPAGMQADIEARIDALRAWSPESMARRGRPQVAGPVVFVEAPSTDALPGALAEAGPHGAVVLEEGLHTQSGTVTISHPVKIFGEPGATLQVATTPSDPSVPTVTVDPALHILSAGGPVLVAGVDLQPASAPGNTGILVEATANVGLAFNDIGAFQVAVLLEEADGATLLGNDIQQDPNASLLGIVAMNGDGVGLAGNKVQGSGFFGTWACDSRGYAAGNEYSGSFIGLILCKVPFGNFQLPDGSLVGSSDSASQWTVFGNRSSGNVVGYMVADGSNHNAMFANDAGNNAAYDIQLTPETAALFGFCTPAVYDNFVQTSDAGDVIKDCGINSTIVGGTLVDLSADPCEPACP